MSATYVLTQSKLMQGAKSAKGGKLRGANLLLFFIEGQNRKIVILRG